jgi:putative ribosome biogenesis GTPase RsgA
MSVSHELIDRLNDLLMDDSEGYDSTINFLFQVMEQTFNNYTYDKESLNKNVVSFVGTTGAGKSTLLNYIAGVKLRVVNNDGLSLSLEVWNKDEAVATIGKGDSQS